MKRVVGIGGGIFFGGGGGEQLPAKKTTRESFKQAKEWCFFI